MDRLAWVDFDDMISEAVKDKAFVQEYEALREEFELAREVIALRKDRNMTQKELAEKVGTSQPAIARLESGRYKNVSLSFLRKVGAALGAQPEVHLRASR